MKTLALTLACVAAFGSTARAQSSGPAAGTPPVIANLYTPIFGVTAGIAIPVGRIADDHGAGYALGGLVEYAVQGQPYALRGELLYQRFNTKAGRTADNTNLTSLGATVVFKNSVAPSNTFVTAGIAIYHANDLGTRPGVNAGGGVEIPLQGFSATGEARLHLMLADGRPALTLPLTVGIRF
jgi:hypothetical protein